MHRCLELAERGRGKTGLNPLVGAVLVRGDQIIAEGWHSEFGCDHAERDLITKFDQDIQQEDALYVNLEPCIHQGKTPPCTELIIEKGIKKVVFGMLDPNPIVAGQGIQALIDHGVEVIGQVERARCERLNRGFTSFVRKGRPWITLKRAQTKDGKIANKDGSPLKITTEEQDQWSHEWLRAKHDAVLVGVETVIRDDPQLTVRLKNKNIVQVNSLRIVLDPNCRTPDNARILNDGTIIVVASGADVPQAIRKSGVKIIEASVTDGVFEFSDLWDALITPADDFNGITSILVEGGPKTWNTFKGQGIVDEEVILIGKRTCLSEELKLNI